MTKDQKNEPLSVEEGNIYAFRIFDIGSEIFLDRAADILKQEKTLHPFGLKKPKRSILIAERPLVINLEPMVVAIKDDVFEVQSVAKLWSFGAISVQMGLKIVRALSLRDLCDIGYFLENDETFHSNVVQEIKNLMTRLHPAIEKASLWSQYEDYLVFDVKKVHGFNGNVKGIFRAAELAPLLLGEGPNKFSSHVIESIEKNTFQYTENDMVIIDWNAALIYDLDDSPDIIQTIEFALCSLLELRFYDDLLDHQLKSLYHQRIDARGPSLFFNPYKELSNKSALQYIEISEVVDRVGNAFKIIGEYYYATIFRFALQRFYVVSWRKSVNNKLSNLAEVSRLFQGETDEYRNQFLSLIIIVLIGIEVMPLIYKLFF